MSISQCNRRTISNKLLRNKIVVTDLKKKLFVRTFRLKYCNLLQQTCGKKSLPRFRRRPPFYTLEHSNSEAWHRIATTPAFWPSMPRFHATRPSSSETAVDRCMVDRCMLSINNSLHLARKNARIFVGGHYLFWEANTPSFEEKITSKDKSFSQQAQFGKLGNIFPRFSWVIFGGSCNFSFLKNSLIPNWTRNRMITYT